MQVLKSGELTAAQFARLRTSEHSVAVTVLVRIDQARLSSVVASISALLAFFGTVVLISEDSIQG